jgi:hypothetical protein
MDENGTWNIKGTISTWNIKGSISTWNIKGTISTWNIKVTISTLPWMTEKKQRKLKIKCNFAGRFLDLNMPNQNFSNSYCQILTTGTYI